MKYLRLIDPDRLGMQYLSIKIKLLYIFSFITISWWLINYDNPWWLVVIYFYFSLFIGRIFLEIGFHRYITHKSFETSKFKNYLLLIGGTLMGAGSCLTFAAVHRAHHKYSDSARDPHSPKNIGIIRTWLTMWDDNWSIDVSTIKDLLRDPLLVVLHKHYFKILLTWIITLGLISYIVNSLVPILLLFAIPNMTVLLSSGFTNSIGHTSGYRNFNTNDNSRNNYATRFLLLSPGLHNNHHAYPNESNLNIRKKWFEFDSEGLFIKYFLKKNKES